MKSAAVLGLLGAVIGTMVLANTSFAMGRGSLIEVDNVQSVKTTTYIFDQGATTGSCDAMGGCQIGPHCDAMFENYKPSQRDADKTIRAGLKAAGYTDQQLKDLYIEIVERGKVEFGGDYPGCTRGIDNVEFQALLPASIVKAHQAVGN